MYNRFIDECESRSSRLYRLPEIATMFIKGALARPYLEAVEWLLSARDTRIAVLPSDIRLYVLTPYLWVGRYLCDIPHRDQFLYGVPHGRVRLLKELWVHYHWGVRHRVGAPAIEGHDHFIYYQNGRPFRESGPTSVAPDRLIFGFAPIKEILVTRRGSILMDLRQGIHLQLTRSGRFIIRLDVTKTRKFRIFDNRIELRTDSVTWVIGTHLFAEIVGEMLAFLLECNVEERCFREWERSRAEIAATN